MGYIFTLLAGVLCLIIIKPQIKTRKRFVLLCISLTAHAQTRAAVDLPCSQLAVLAAKPKTSLWSCTDCSRTLKGSAVLHRAALCRAGVSPQFWVLQGMDCTFVLGFLGLLFGGLLMCQTTVRIASKIFFFFAIELQNVLMQCLSSKSYLRDMWD